MRRPLAALLLAGLAVLAGCGGQLSITPDKGIRIGFVPKALNQEYWVNTAHGAAAGGAKAHAPLRDSPKPDRQTPRWTSKSTSCRTCWRRRSARS